MAKDMMPRFELFQPTDVDNALALATKYGGVESMPTSFVIDKQGRIVATHVGLVSKKDYQDDIEKLLGPVKVVAPKRSSVPARSAGQLGAE